MTRELWHEIACQLAFFELTLDDAATVYGNDIINAGLEPISFMHKCLCAERSVLSRHEVLFSASAVANDACLIKLSIDNDALQLFLLYFDQWYPEDLGHLRYLHWRTVAFTEHYEYAEELAARLAAAEASAAMDNILRGLK